MADRFRGTLASGVVATVTALIVILLLSLVVRFPWSLAQALVGTGIASFSAGAIGYHLGFRAGGRREAE
jgi:Na+/H+-translocating membrane pyrophosphatase